MTLIAVRSYGGIGGQCIPYLLFTFLHWLFRTWAGIYL